jgi:hypothetical protein
MATTVQKQGYWWNPFRSDALPAPVGKVQTTWLGATLQLAATAASGITATLQAGANGVVSLVKAAQDPIIGWAVQNHPEMFLHLHIVVEEIQNNIANGKTGSQANRNELAERLEDFVKEFSPAEKPFFEQFCADLKNTSIIFDKSKENEMLRLIDILTPHVEKHAAYILTKIGERQRLERLLNVENAPPSATLSKEETITGIQAQIDMLKSNSIKMVLGSIILNTTLGISTLDLNAMGIDCVKLGIDPPNERTNLVNFLLEVSQKMKIEGMSSKNVFQMLLERAIDNSDRNIFVRYHAKLRCKFLPSLISSYLNSLFNKLKGTLVHFANLSPEQQLQHITDLLINPVNDHLSNTEKALADIDKDRNALNGQNLKIAGSVPKLLAALLANKNPDAQTTEQLLDTFVEAFLDQFIDPIHQHWTRSARMKCLEKATRSSLFGKGVFKGLAGLAWLAGKVVAPFQWTLNESIRFILKKSIVSMCPGLFGTVKDSLGVGSSYSWHSWHSLKKNLVTMLQQVRLNRLKPRKEDPAYRPSNTNPAAAEKINTLIDHFLKVLASPEATGTHQESQPLPNPVAAFEIFMKGFDFREARSAQDDLTNFLGKDGRGLVASLQGQVNNPTHSKIANPITMVKNTVTELAVDICSEEGFINGIILSSLKSTNTASFVANPVIVTEEDKKKVEEDLNQELGLLGENILQIVKESTRTDKRYQTNANVIVNTIKQHVRTFQEKFLRISNNPDARALNLLEGLFTEFNQSMAKLRDDIPKKVDAATAALLMPYLDESLARAQETHDSVAQPTPVEADRSLVDLKLQHLSKDLQNPFDTEEEVLSTLSQLKILNPSFLNVDALEKDIFTTIEAYTSKLLFEKGKERHPRALDAHPLQASLQAVMERYREKTAKAAHRHEKLFKVKIVNEFLLNFDRWASDLNYVKVDAKPTFADATLVITLGMPGVNSVVSSLIQSYGKNLFHVISQESHLNGIIQRTMDAYINKPPMLRTPAPGQSPLPKRVKRRRLSETQLDKLTAFDWAVLNPI